MGISKLELIVLVEEKENFLRKLRPPVHQFTWASPFPSVDDTIKLIHWTQRGACPCGAWIRLAVSSLIAASPDALKSCPLGVDETPGR